MSVRLSFSTLFQWSFPQNDVLLSSSPASHIPKPCAPTPSVPLATTRPYVRSSMAAWSAVWETLTWLQFYTKVDEWRGVARKCHPGRIRKVGGTGCYSLVYLNLTCFKQETEINWIKRSVFVRLFCMEPFYLRMVTVSAQSVRLQKIESDRPTVSHSLW